MAVGDGNHDDAVDDGGAGRRYDVHHGDVADGVADDVADGAADDVADDVADGAVDDAVDDVDRVPQEEVVGDCLQRYHNIRG